MLYWRKFDPRLLDAQFEADIRAFFESLPGDWYVTAGHRTRREQSKLYEIYKNGGPKAAPPGKSAHNYGLAIDVVLDCDPDKGLQPSWNIKLKQWLVLKSRLLTHPTLEHGSAFGDWPHIQRRHWRKEVLKNWGIHV